jgi:arabinofuranan 3-O-arabinosyltransferase
VLLVLAVLLVAVVLANDWAVLTPDTKPEIFLAPWRTAARFAMPWLDSPSLGAPSFNVGVAPVAAALGVLGAGLPPWLAMRVWRILLLLLAAWGARRLYRDVVTGSSADRAVGRVAVAVAYVANPYVVSGGGTTPTMLPYAVMPWFLLLTRRAVRDRSWTTGCMAALALAATSGLNAGVVGLLQLTALLPLVTYVLVVDRVALRQALAALVRVGVVFAGLSLYWLVPTVGAVAAGSTVAASTESIDAINVANSYAEVVRGLGLWTLYGGSAQNPFTPGHLSYLTAPVVVLLTFLPVAFGTLGARMRARPVTFLGAMLLLTGALVMVGTFPDAGPSVWGRAVRVLLDDVPGAIAFRTTNKAGAVLELGVALLVGVACVEVARRVRRPVIRTVLVVTGLATVAAGVAPVWSGDLFPVRLDLPSYWSEAAAQVNASGSPGRVAVVPGLRLAEYSWGYTGPDDLGSSLFRQQNVVRTTTSSGSPSAVGMLAETDSRLLDGTSPPGTVSALLGYLGAGQVVGRYDSLTPVTLSGRVESSLAQDPGLGPVSGFGPPTGGVPSTVTVRDRKDSQVVMARPGRGALLVDGDGAALPSLQAAGLLDGAPALLPAAGMSAAAVQRAVEDGARYVITDTNARRQRSVQNQQATSPLLTADDPHGDGTAVGTPDDQTVAVLKGGARLTTEGRGTLFGPVPQSDPALAFDGDPSTAWRFGNFGTGPGNAVTVHFDEPTDVPEVSVRVTNDSGVRASRLRVTATGAAATVTRDLDLTEWSTFPGVADLAARDVDSLRVEVVETQGPAFGSVGIAEVTVPALSLQRVARTPVAVAEQMAAWGDGARTALEGAPVDVVLRRRTGPADGQAVEEARLDREVQLPAERAFAVAGTARIAPTAPDADVDRVAGTHSDVEVTTSSRAFGNLALRGAAALDGTVDDADLSTAWVPMEPVVGEWILARFPARPLDRFTITQPEIGPVATKVLVSVDDGQPFERTLGPGVSTVQLPRFAKASSVRVLVAERSRPGLVRFEDIGIARTHEGVRPEDCMEVATVDGRPVLARLEGTTEALLAGQPVPFRGCGPELALGEGPHRIGSAGPLVADDLWMTSSGGSASAAPAGPGPIDAELASSSATRRVVRLPAGCDPCYVSSGQGFDPRWVASVGGKDLGAPVVVDGYAAGWRVQAAPGAVVEMEYGPRRAALLAWAASALVLLGCMVLVLRRRVRGSPTAAREDAAAAVPAATAVPVAGAQIGPRGPATRPLPALLLVLAVLITVGWPAALGAGVVAAWAVLSGRRQRYLDASLVLLLAVPVVVLVAAPDGLVRAVQHIQDGWPAHQLAGLAVWLLLAGAVPTGAAPATSRSPSTMTPDVDHPR